MKLAEIFKEDGLYKAVLIEMLNEMYDIGVEDGGNMFYNTECSCSKEDLYEIISKDKHVEILLQKYLK